MRDPKLIKTILQLAALTTFILGLVIILAPDLIIKWFDGNSAGNNHFVRFVGENPNYIRLLPSLL